MIQRFWYSINVYLCISVLGSKCFDFTILFHECIFKPPSCCNFTANMSIFFLSMTAQSLLWYCTDCTLPVGFVGLTV